MAAAPENNENPAINDSDPQETREWQEALTGVIGQEGTGRAHFLIQQLIAQAREEGIDLPYSATTEYINTIPVDRQPMYPGDATIEIRIRNFLRWNAMAMVVRANHDTNVGGHIASYASSAALYDVGFNWFWRGQNENHGGDLVFFQGHSIARRLCARPPARPAIRRADEQLPPGSRRQGPVVLPAPLADARFLAFPDRFDGTRPAAGDLPGALHEVHGQPRPDRSQDRKVWAFLGDGETDESNRWAPSAWPAREKLDNLIFVINCNLQRLDGPVRGNGKIIQELESTFRGAGWNVIKLIWGRHWDVLFERDKKGILKKRMMEAVDGEYQTFKAKNGAYVREHFFNTPELQELVADWTDADIWNLNRGGHDIFKIYSAFKAAVEHPGTADADPGQDDQGLRHGRSG